MNNFPREERTINGRKMMVTICPARSASGALPFHISPIVSDNAVHDALASRQGPCDGDAEHFSF